MGKHRPLCSGARYGWMMIEQNSAGFIEEASPHIPRHHHQLAICVICTGHMHITCYILLLIIPDHAKSSTGPILCITCQAATPKKATFREDFPESLCRADPPTLEKAVLFCQAT